MKIISLTDTNEINYTNLSIYFIADTKLSFIYTSMSSAWG